MKMRPYEKPEFELLDLVSDDVICNSLCVLDGSPVICSTDACATPFDN